MEKLLLKPGEAAELLGLSRTKVYDLIARGELPSVRVGSSVRVRAGDLAVWIRALKGTEGSGERTPSASAR